MTAMRIGVLAVQGAFAEHIDVLREIGADGVPVRLPAHLEHVSGLILPGGESTTMRKLIARWGLSEPIQRLIEEGVPVLGTCAGMILLSRRITDGDEPVFPVLDVDIRRNAFGRQLESFEADLDVPLLGERPVHAVFIRAPIAERVGPAVEVLARLADGRVVAVRQRNVIATAFHPELAGEVRFHRLLLTMASDHDEPAEGSARRRHPLRRDAGGRVAAP
jgi:pyridoxal 5'-phosphate synthase pdxT subunit